ncbi:MAG: hypothetical protein ACXAEN_25905 [Candidatus Thorarchaeota archaeon]|jgi:hypothetical protein
MQAREFSYLLTILILFVALLISNGRATSHAITQDSAIRLCETASRLLDNRIKELSLQIEVANNERDRLLGLHPKPME